MSKVYISSVETEFGAALAEEFTNAGYEVTTEVEEGLEYFIDVTDAYIENDVQKIGEGLDTAAIQEAYHQNVTIPMQKLNQAMPTMTGKKRICFITSEKSSVNMSKETVNFGHNMSKAGMHQIVMMIKNRAYDDGYTFRLFDPETGSYCPKKAAKSAFVYFTRVRFFDNTPNPDREDEKFIKIRNAHGIEIPW